MSASAPQKVLIGWSDGQGASASGSLILDASISEMHGITAEATTQPVETGSDVADNVRVLPQTLQIEGFVTNTPLGIPDSYSDGVLGSVAAVTTLDGVTFSAFQFNDSFDRVREVFGDLIDAIQGAALFNVVTTLTNYTNLACISFQVPRSVDKGNVLRFTMQLQALLFVDSQTVTALPPKVQKVHRGAKPGKPLDPKKDAAKISVLDKAVNAAVAFFSGVK